jgi:GDP-4-dehydro-6-deoxy-D-mannose reductase
LRTGLEETRPDYVVHLAAQSFVPRSFADPHETFEINFLGTLNLLEALKACGFRGRILYVGSGDEYGVVYEEDLPIIESHPLRPRNPYAVSKAAAEMLCYQWCQTEGMNIVMVRPFNHIGPGQDERFAVSNFAKQVIEIKRRRHKPIIEAGDLTAVRDFTDVIDVARAYFALLEGGKAGEVYNVCSGEGRSLGNLLQRMLVLAGVRAEIVTDSARLRPSEQKRVVGSNRKLVETTGWQPEITIEQSLQNILDDWERRLSNG